MTLEVPLEHLAEGGAETVHDSRPTQCHACGGSGACAGTSPCRGTGRLTTSRREPGMVMQQITTCPSCHARGTIIDDPCSACTGSGTVRSEESLPARIPAGIEDGTASRVPGRGMPSPEWPGAAGDLLVIFRAGADERFERRGSHLHRHESVTFADAVLGTTLRVPRLGRPCASSWGPGTQPGMVLRVAGKGLPIFRGAGRGDLYVQIGVRIPDEISAEERTLYEQLRTLSAAHTRHDPAPALSDPPRRRWRRRRRR